MRKKDTCLIHNDTLLPDLRQRMKMYVVDFYNVKNMGSCLVLGTQKHLIFRCFFIYT